MAGITVAVVGVATDPGLPVTIETGVVTEELCVEVEATATEGRITVVKGKATEPGLVEA